MGLGFNNKRRIVLWILKALFLKIIKFCALQIKGKTAQQCVEFYYLWKACRTEGTRSRRGYTEEIESEVCLYYRVLEAFIASVYCVFSLQQHENVDIPSDDESETFFFVCDFPECNSVRRVFFFFILSVSYAPLSSPCCIFLPPTSCHL